MTDWPVYGEISGPIVMIGFGSIGRGTLPLIERNFVYDPRKVYVIAPLDDVEIDTNVGNHSVQGDQPRTAIGMIGANHFLFVAVDGRSTGYSRGMTMTELAQLLLDRGAKVGYNLDGGGSTTMVLNGNLVNNPLGRDRERGTSDIIYVAG